MSGTSDGMGQLGLNMTNEDDQPTEEDDGLQTELRRRSSGRMSEKKNAYQPTGTEKIARILPDIS